MKELRDIVRAYELAQQEGKQAALATVVQVQGSSYRRPGARMLVTEDGQLTGAISGGCLEGDALRRARLVMLEQKARLVTYDTTDEDDAKLGIGLGCNGVIQILIEPINPDAPANPITFFRSFLSSRQSAVIITLFSLGDRKVQQPGTCLFLSEKGASIGACPDAALQDVILADGYQALRSGTSSTRTYTWIGGELTGFVEVLQPAVSLVIAGAGNDAVPLTQMAALLGWQVTVVDGRANHATVTRFPEAQRVIVAKPEQAMAQLIPDARTVFVLMTHNYNYDIAMLRQLLPLKPPYIGSLGPRKKLERMLSELRSDGMTITDEMLQRVYGPTGLDIGAETSEEIALAIVAEIKAVLMGKPGTRLREKSGTIHEREEEALEMVHQFSVSGCSL